MSYQEQRKNKLAKVETNRVIKSMTTIQAKKIFIDECIMCKDRLMVKVILEFLGRELQNEEYENGISCREIILNAIILKSAGLKTSLVITGA